MAKLPTRRRIFDVVGEGQINPDGTARQAILREARPGDALYLLREPENPYDAHAIRVECDAGTVGYLNRDDAKLLAPFLDQGREAKAQIHEYRGTLPDYPSIGCRLSIAWEDRHLPEPIALERDQEIFLERSEKLQSNRGCFGSFLFMLILPVALFIIV